MIEFIEFPRRRVAIAGVVVLMIVGGMMGSAAVASSGEVVKGTVVGGVPVEGLKAAELMARLAPAAKALDRRPLTLAVGDREWVRSSEAMGISVDLRATAQQAMMQGRTSSLSWMLASMGSGQRSLGWVPSIDEDRLGRALEELARLVEVEASNGDFSVAGAQVTVRPPTNGYSLLAEPARQALVRAAVRPSASDRVELPVTVTPPEVTVEQLDRVKLQAEAILSAPVDFVHEARAFKVAAEKIAPALRVSRDAQTGDGEASNLTLEADPAVLKESIVAEAPFVNRAPKDASFSFSGDKVVLQPSQDGATIKTEEAADALVQLTATNRRAISLPSTVQPASLSTEAASKLGIKQRIATYTTPFDSRNAPRVGNIDRMASAISGTVLKPGQVFSLNQTTGNRTVANGYQEAGILVDGELVPGIGGGVCQVATTLFNAVFSAGLEVVERSNHSLFVSSYPTGKDAMVNYGVQDLKFRNDTEFGILLRTSVSAKELTVSIYSSPLGRVVTESTSARTNPRVPEVKYLEDPSLPGGTEVVSAEGIPGFDVTVTRRVVAGGKVLHSDNFVSKYRPWKRIIKKGTGPAAGGAVPAEPSDSGAEQATPSEDEQSTSPTPSDPADE